VLRVGQQGLSGRETKEWRIELVHAIEKADGRHVTGVRREVAQLGRDLVRVEALYGLAAGAQVLPVGGKVGRAGEAARHSNDRDSAVVGHSRLAPFSLTVERTNIRRPNQARKAR
jgi:hypothetical protein